MSTAVVAPPPAEPTPSKSFGARFIGVFISPDETFADVARKPDFIAPLIVAVIMTAAMAETMLAKIGTERIVRWQLEHSSRAASMTPEQINAAAQQAAKFVTIFAHASFLIVPIGMLVIAAIGLAVVNGIFGGQMSYKTAFSVTCYANLVAVIPAIMGIALILFGDPEHFNAQSPVPTNAGFFLDPATTSKPLLSLSSSFDIFTLWLIALLGIGYSEAVARKVKPLSVGLTLFGLWFVWVLAKMGLATLGS